ncbi:uncharacterized protein LOC131847563 isoform X2 [Achroia grisella]|uniref:uncharacterized protein LOC131847563 isoform X2 n=1 Tax=Achroia grisella TaxID=688607 RepID=UPI0027D234DA|nr:uncharacterized protein LOC131847563 isoform X2 [Achroia grisella]
MSIPPLVCSTPPPPEQCEDDKDTEDFDMQYNHSNYDDDDNTEYNYGDFSSFNHYKSSLSENIEESSSIGNIENFVNNGIFSESDFHTGKITGASITNKLSTEEDIVEDLGLKLDEESVNVNSKNEPKDEVTLTDGNDGNNSIREELPNILSNINNNMSNIPTTQNIDDYTESLEHVEDLQSFDVVDESTVVMNESEKNQDLQNTSVVVSETSKEELDRSLNAKNEDILNEDFDDFQFISSHNKDIDNIPGIVDTIQMIENPWENVETENSDFGNFTANFENINSNQLNTTLSHTDLSTDYNQTQTQKKATQSVENEDEFGDFDDFKSSVVETIGTTLPQAHESLYQQVPVLNLQSPDTEVQIMERINNILTSIFEEEFKETEEKFEGTLDGLLSETWGHLVETDVRQPYMVNWSKSLAQKTLLKALCIDSRNILFSPKWSCNSMPKYAANLSTAPLQPQKQTTPGTMQREISNNDKVTNKSGTWTDPFTSNGQESCSNNSNKTVIEPAPTDLDVFEAAMSTKGNKIYSSTLSVQPIRQINLPDTHIFTPTDSETPRSKTIHYDCGPAPTVLIPQPVMDNVQNKENKIINSVDNVISNNAETDEYWDFQDFKGTSGTSTTLQNITVTQNQPQLKEEATSNTLPKTNIIYETQLLEPIKIEPIMPTLNWPDPGEVKETFDDFADFVSSSCVDKQDVKDLRHNDHDISYTTQSALVDKNVPTVIKKMEKKQLASSSSFEDEFDTFQSALSSNTNTTFEFNFGSLESKSSQNVENLNVSTPSKTNDFNIVNSVMDNLKSDNISLPNNENTTDPLSTNVDITSSIVVNMNTGTGLAPGISIDNTNMLQPTPISHSNQVQSNSGLTQTQHKSGQILQPLSLESYSQINWPNPGIDLQDLSRFNPVESLQSLKNESTSSHSKTASPVHNKKNIVNNQNSDDDIWGEFVSSKPKQQSQPPKKSTFVDDDEWTDFVSSPNLKPNSLNTISFNVHTNSNIQKSTNQKKYGMKNNQIPLDIPSLNYITPKTNSHNSYNDRHFQNL